MHFPIPLQVHKPAAHLAAAAKQLCRLVRRLAVQTNTVHPTTPPTLRYDNQDTKITTIAPTPTTSASLAVNLPVYTTIGLQLRLGNSSPILLQIDNNALQHIYHLYDHRLYNPHAATVAATAFTTDPYPTTTSTH